MPTKRILFTEAHLYTVDLLMHCCSTTLKETIHGHSLSVFVKWVDGNIFNMALITILISRNIVFIVPYINSILVLHTI